MYITTSFCSLFGQIMFVVNSLHNVGDIHKLNSCFLSWYSGSHRSDGYIGCQCIWISAALHYTKVG